MDEIINRGQFDVVFGDVDFEIEQGDEFFLLGFFELFFGGFGLVPGTCVCEGHTEFCADCVAVMLGEIVV